jgi:CBS-domain-containing membrane protein
MWDHDCGVVPVVNEAGVVLGVITDRDVCMAAYIQGAKLTSIRAGSVMSRQLQSCAPGSSVEIALSIMKESRVRRLPVIDARGQIVGIVSLNDLAREAAQRRRRGDCQLAAEVADTLAAICGTRGSVRTESELRAPEPESVPSRRMVLTGAE